MFDKKISAIFDDMHNEYDQINDLWYSWLFSRLHYLISKKITSKWKHKHKVLDIGCGTGFQSLLYSRWGAEVVGIDISEKLIQEARNKLDGFNDSGALSFFDPKFDFALKYEKKLQALLRNKASGAPVIPPIFQIGDAQKLDFKDESFDHINCCGSTLSFVEDYISAIHEIDRCLKPNGTFIFEVESKNNLDLIWTLLDSSLFFGALKYETSFKEAVKQTFFKIGKHIKVEYPFGDVKDPVYMDIQLFKKSKLIKELKYCGVKVEKCYSINSITNLIPSTISDTSNPGPILTTAFSLLSALEDKFTFFLPGCSLVLIGRKINSN